MQIQRIKHKRQITDKEFLRLKKTEPFASYRQDSKGLNFGLLFGMSYRTYSQTRLETNWTLEQCEKFIEEHNLMDSKWDIAKFYKNEDPKLWSYYAVSKYFRDMFFKTYPKLMKRIEWRKAEGANKGYIRSYHGALRHVLPVKFEGKDDSKKEIAGLGNICANTDIQNDEACRVMPSIVMFNEKAKALGLKSRIIGTIHDSVDFIIYKPELDFIAQSLVPEIFERDEPWQKGIKLTTDFTIVDLTKEDQYFKHGKEYVYN